MTTEIEIPSRGGLRGRIERLAHEYMLKASALKITVEILDEDDRKTALQAAPKKFLAAIEHRNGNEPKKKSRTFDRKPQAERLDQIRAFLAAQPGASSRDVADAIGVTGNTITKLAPLVATAERRGSGGQNFWTLKRRAARPGDDRPAISGKRLTLFVLEHLSEAKPSTAQQLLNALQLNGSKNNPKGMNGTMGSLVRAGWVRVNGSDGYTLTSKGNSHQVKLRNLLEARGQITADAYVAT